MYLFEAILVRIFSVVAAIDRASTYTLNIQTLWRTAVPYIRNRPKQSKYEIDLNGIWIRALSGFVHFKIRTTSNQIIKYSRERKKHANVFKTINLYLLGVMRKPTRFHIYVFVSIVIVGFFFIISS